MIQKVVSFLLILLGFSYEIYAQSENHALELVLNDGNKTVFLLQDKPIISFNQDVMIIESQTFSTAYLLSTIKEYHFIDSNIVTGIESSVGRYETIIQTSNEIILKGCGNKNIEVFDLEGKKIPVEIVKFGDSIQLPFSFLMPNICIIKVDEKTIKIKIK